MPTRRNGRRWSISSTSQVFPALTPLVIGRGRPFPYISNLSLSSGSLLRNPEKDKEVAARVKVPKELLRRFLSIGDGLTFVPLEDVIAANLDDLFPGMEIVHQSMFRVTRDTDYDVSDEADDLLLAVEEEVRRRRFGEVVRLEVAPTWSRASATSWSRRWTSIPSRSSRARAPRPRRSLRHLFGPGFRELRYPAWQGVTPPQLQQGSRDQREVDVFGAMRQGDSSCTTHTTPLPALWSASCARRSRTRTCSRSSRRSTGPAPTRRWSRV